MEIGNLYNADGGMVIDNSQTVNIQQNTNNCNSIPIEPEESKENTTTPALINRTDRLSKRDLFRLIAALYKYGAFKSSYGEKLTKKRVFTAFETMLGEDFGNYDNALGYDKIKTLEISIFKKLETAYSEYIRDLEND